jgi:hypothetical protein
VGLRDKIRKLLGGGDATEEPLPPDALDVRGAIDGFLAEFTRRTRDLAPDPLRWKEAFAPKPAEYASARLVLESERSDQVRALRYVFERWGAGKSRGRGYYDRGDEVYALKALANQLLRRNLPCTTGDLVALLDASVRAGRHTGELPWGGLLRVVGRQLGGAPADGELKEALRRAERAIRGSGGTGFGQDGLHADAAKWAARIGELIRGVAAGTPEIEPGEAWADAALADFAAMEVPEREAWTAILAHAARTRSAKPSKKWLKDAEALLEGTDDAAGRLATWFERVPEKTTSVDRGTEREWGTDRNLLICPANAALLRGLAWTAIRIEDERLARAVGAAAASCFRKVPGHGPRAPKVGNACVLALAEMPGREPVAQLVRLRTRAQHASTRNRIAKALATAAERAGLGELELEELATSDFGMQEVGLLRTPVGEFTAEIAVTGTVSAQLSWRTQKGKPQKSVPKSVKEEHADELKALKRTLKDVRDALPSQRDRIERLLLPGWSRDVATWRERYLDQPLVGSLARRLVWALDAGGTTRTVAWLDGRLVDASDAAVEPSDDARVRLWHPIESDVDTVVAWREWLEHHQVTQPFKQAHREIYVLTDAERATETYSNRFAAHILRQHQFQALCRTRGWQYALQGTWDSHNTPTLDLPRQGFAAEFWVAGDWDAGEQSESAVFLSVNTDQVRFYRSGENVPIPLADVPPLVFSEVMRDVDLFVGVCSIGADPAWGDRGAYWHEASFGQLNAAAETRREVLERLLPRLKIADRCELSGKFLRVRGNLRAYKIHLGSGNILMEPADTYLCIVPGRGKAQRTPHGKLFLPFEGDGVLAVVLSKAFLLAADDEIDDPTIVGQIRR